MKFEEVLKEINTCLLRFDKRLSETSIDYLKTIYDGMKNKEELRYKGYRVEEECDEFIKYGDLLTSLESNKAILKIGDKKYILKLEPIHKKQI